MTQDAIAQMTFLADMPSRERPAPAYPVYDKAPRRVLTVRELPESERPVNRLHFYGPPALSTTELLAILAGTPYQLQDAANLMATFEGLDGLARAATIELVRQPGIGTAAAARIKAGFELGRRLLTEVSRDRHQIRSPADAANLLLPEMGLLDKEELRVIILDTKNRVVDIVTVYVGSVNTTMIRVSELFRDAIRHNCPATIVVHNHPSGDPTPSPEDVAVTRQIVEAGKLLDIDVLDHLILGAGGHYVSLKERGLGF
jgi:DNA repair protein RadC